MRRSSVRRPTGRPPRRGPIRRALTDAREHAAAAAAGKRPVRRVARALAAVSVRLASIGVATVVALVGLGVLGVIPVRAYVQQQREIEVAQRRLGRLEAENSELASQAKLLRTPSEIERLARRQFGMVRPGEQAFAIPGLRPANEGIIADESLPPAIGAAPPPSVPAKPSLWSELVELSQIWR